MNFSDVQKKISKVDGWLLRGEAELLFNTAKNCKGAGKIVEIGSWKGKSTICLASGSILGPRTKIIAIDPHIGSSEHQKTNKKVDTFSEFKANLKKAGVDKMVTPFVKKSEEVANHFNEPVEFIFIDGAHEYELVKLDFRLWFPKVINGGTMAFHDSTCFPGPKKLVEEMVYKSRNFRNVNFVDSTTIAEKVERNTFKERLRNRYVLCLKKIYEISGMIHPPAFVKNFGKRIVKLIH